MSKLMFLRAKQSHQILLAEPIQNANISIRFVSNKKLGSKSSIFQQAPQHGTARQTNWREPNQLAQKEWMQPSGLSSFSIWPLISSCLLMANLWTGWLPQKIRLMDPLMTQPKEISSNHPPLRHSTKPLGITGQAVVPALLFRSMTMSSILLLLKCYIKLNLTVLIFQEWINLWQCTSTMDLNALHQLFLGNIQSLLESHALISCCIAINYKL